MPRFDFVVAIFRPPRHYILFKYHIFYLKPLIGTCASHQSLETGIPTRLYFSGLLYLFFHVYEYSVRVIFYGLIKQLKENYRESLSLRIWYIHPTRARKRGVNVNVITSSARIPWRYPKSWALSKLISLPPIRHG